MYSIEYLERFFSINQRYHQVVTLLSPFVKRIKCPVISLKVV
ncbi:hypothetical protein HMPREF1002_04422 [Porphyromonas sp. 31_2]|nr:hypothetical protein HMPREF1002_04422 [Porphyromonas sp. 31_2]